MGGVNIMKLKFNLKEGIEAELDVDVIEGSGNFLELVQKGVNNNAKVTLRDDNQIIERNWSDVKSIEIIL